MAADRPLKSNFFLGLLEGLLGILDLAAPGVGNPPSSSREGAGHAWSSAMREAISRIEQREVEAPGTMGLPPSLDLCYEVDFLERQKCEIPPVFSDPLFIPHMAKAMFNVVKPPVVLKVLPSTTGHGVPFAEASGMKESAPSASLPHQLDQGQVSEAPSTDAGETDKATPEEEPPPQSSKVKLPFKPQKRGHKATTTSSKDDATPSKVQKESGANEAEAFIPTRLSEAALYKAWFELYEKDLPEVQDVRALILGLSEGEEVTQ